MRYVFLCVLLSIGVSVFGQNPTNYIPYKQRTRQYSMALDSMFYLPRYNGTPSGVRANEVSTIDGAMAVDTTNGRVYVLINGAWKRIANWNELGIDSIWRVPGTDSIYWSKYGVTYKILDSTGGGSSYTFSNGLTESAGTVKLGGTISENTVVDNQDYRLDINGQSAATSRVWIRNQRDIQLLADAGTDNSHQILLGGNGSAYWYNNNNSNAETGISYLQRSSTDNRMQFIMYGSQAPPNLTWKDTMNQSNNLIGLERTRLGLRSDTMYWYTAKSVEDTTGGWFPVVRNATTREMRPMTTWPNGGATPTLQQVLTAGSTLTTDNTIDVGGNLFTINNAGELRIYGDFVEVGYDGYSAVSAALGASSLKGGDVSRLSILYLSSDSMLLQPSFAKLNIDSLRTWSDISDTLYKKPMTWDTRNGRWEYAANWFGSGGGGGSGITVGATTISSGTSGRIAYNNGGVYGETAGITYQSGASPNLLIQAQNSTYTSLVVKGAASQSANIQEWQNSSGTVIGRFESGGRFGFSDYIQAIGTDVLFGNILGDGYATIQANQSNGIKFRDNGGLIPFQFNYSNTMPVFTINSGVLDITNGTAPTASVTNGVRLYAEDVSSSAELKVRDEAGNITTLSPHNFGKIPGGRSEKLAWSFYSERNGEYITADMTKALRTIEKQSEEIEELKAQIAELKGVIYQKKAPVKLVYKGKK